MAVMMRVFYFKFFGIGGISVTNAIFFIIFCRLYKITDLSLNKQKRKQAFEEDLTRADIFINKTVIWLLSSACW